MGDKENKLCIGVFREIEKKDRGVFREIKKYVQGYFSNL